MSRTHAQKLRQIRKAEGLTQSNFAEMVGIALSTVKNYESGQRDVGLAIIDTVLKHSRFEKYALWLMTDKTALAAGQIAPPLSPDGQDETKSQHLKHKTG
ncbi:TPA: helix-turn-helix transcriptional regulator [Citrobacter freundii]|uniref:helix-turn-helix transcriptional regulator n=1 Tax=Citrobacter freundii TaxID=546 RepID=UPI001C29CD43|nr:helix-turn-helix transcriptional regulator [Citrobacter freundii]EKX5204217.1 helix-turn-helix transcriptional regulator [Citrobacter freundii]MCJ8533297.1 helix-turn-helix domain-containing protein [Citrobacter freundii]HBG9400104.1 helix-turn-helix transcriptional regulator [Citrobacter freundii]HCB1818430.1 helix-turn-helix transcriptional regulator [Citrobacter freundii]